MPNPLRIGLAGLGVVGQETARLIIEEAGHISAQAGRDVVLSAYSVRDANKPRAVDLKDIAHVPNAADLAARDDVDVVVELIGGADGVAHETAVATLGAGKALISANKAMLAMHWQELFSLSAAHNAPLKFEAAVGGGMPVIKMLREGLAGNRIHKISGILNGTCNFVLSAMEGGVSFDEALLDAQNKGFAEADASFDIDGIDSAHKLLILAKLAFSPELSVTDIDVEGIGGVDMHQVQEAARHGGALRLVAHAVRGDGGRIDMRVRPEIMPGSHMFSHVNGALNAVQIDAVPVETLTLMGQGAGAGPTASAVLADIIDLARLG